VCLSFALRYLNMFNKASTLCNYVKLMLATETPLVVEYEIESLGTLKYYLAPKINEDA
jgi:proliferating cell nuclear antigen